MLQEEKNSKVIHMTASKEYLMMFKIAIVHSGKVKYEPAVKIFMLFDHIFLRKWEFP